MKEFSIIKHYFQSTEQSLNHVTVGSGDDAAVVSVPVGHELVLSMDTLVSGVHFPEDASPANIASKALTVNLSDLAAMGAEPAWLTASLTMPTVDEAWLTAFSQRLFEQTQYYNIALIGGDMTQGPLSLTVQVHGFVPVGQALLRSGAQVGDLIYVTGYLGDAALGLKQLQGDLSKSVTTEQEAYLLQRYYQPTPRLILAKKLRGIATAAIDISDGFLADLGHILEQSGVGAEVDVEALPLSKVMSDCSEKKEAYQLALNGGDDYEICFTVPAEKKSVLEHILQEIDTVYTCVGKITEQGIRCMLSDGNEYHNDTRGFEHFS